MFKFLLKPQQSLTTYRCTEIDSLIERALPKAINKSITIGDTQYEYYCGYHDEQFVEYPVPNSNFFWEVSVRSASSESSSRAKLTAEQTYTAERLKERLVSFKIDPFIPQNLAYKARTGGTNSTKNLNTSQQSDVEDYNLEHLDRNGYYLQMQPLPNFSKRSSTNTLAVQQDQDDETSETSTSSSIASALDTQSLDDDTSINSRSSIQSISNNDLKNPPLNTRKGIIEKINSTPPAQIDEEIYHSFCPVLKMPISIENMVKLTLRGKDHNGDIIEQTFICSREAAYHCAMASNKPKEVQGITFQTLNSTDIEQVTTNDEKFNPLYDNKKLFFFTTNTNKRELPFPINTDKKSK